MGLTDAAESSSSGHTFWDVSKTTILVHFAFIRHKLRLRYCAHCEVGFEPKAVLFPLGA